MRADLPAMGYVLGGFALAMSLSVMDNAYAQSEAPDAAFTTDEAAKCAAVYAFTLDAMSVAQDVPRTIRNAMRDGLAVWEYELTASAPAATTEDLQAAANRAIAYVRADMPVGETQEAAQARGDFLTNSAKQCKEMVAEAYNGKEHPVIPFLRQAEVTVGDPTLPPSPAPSASAAPPPVTASAEEVPQKKGRGLR